MATDHEDAVCMLESVSNAIIVAGAAMVFLFGREVRIKRTQVLRDLRAMAQVIDMHQLTKAPAGFCRPTANPGCQSPKRILTPHQLTRYLDYCSEMLSLTGNLPHCTLRVCLTLSSQLQSTTSRC